MLYGVEGYIAETLLRPLLLLFEDPGTALLHHQVPALLSAEKIQLLPFHVHPFGAFEVYVEGLGNVAPQLLLQRATPLLSHSHSPVELLVVLMTISLYF
jgi:hypothetical protein